VIHHVSLEVAELDRSIAFYDSVVPKIAGGVLKKLGGKVGTVDVNDPSDSTLTSERYTSAQPGIVLTDAMREKIGAGLPLFAALAQEQTNTPEFKRWFGKSKVVDQAGDPLVMHHGTAAAEDFDAFNSSDMEFHRVRIERHPDAEQVQRFVVSAFVVEGMGVLVVFVGAEKAFRHRRSLQRQVAPN